MEQQIQEKIDFIKSKGYSIKILNLDDLVINSNNYGFEIASISYYKNKLNNIELRKNYSNSVIINILDGMIDNIKQLEKLTEINPIFEKLIF